MSVGLILLWILIGILIGFQIGKEYTVYKLRKAMDSLANKIREMAEEIQKRQEDKQHG